MTARLAPDVAIIGGGIIGVAAAAYLAAEGVRVTVFEREAVAAAASGRNSGVIQQPFDPALVTLYTESLRLYRELQDASGRAFALAAEPAGLLYVGFDEGGATEMAAAWAAAHPGTNPAVLAGAELRALDPALAPDVVACRLDIGYPVVPAATTRAFAALALERGAELRIGGEARLAFRDGRLAGIEVDGRFEAAASVLVAAGPWTPPIVDPSGDWQPIRRSWGVVADVRLDRPPRHVLEEMGIDIEPGDPDAPPGDGAGGGVDFSLVTAGGSSSLGSTFLPVEPDPAGYAESLRARGARFVPEIGEAPILGLRTCARPVALDGRPIIGPVPGLDGVYVAAGNGPWGISTGPATARLIVDVLLGRGPLIPEAFDPGRFGPIPGPRSS